MNKEQIKIQIMDALAAVPMGANTGKISVDVDWLLYFAKRILEAVPAANHVRYEGPVEPVLHPLVHPLVQKAKSIEPTEPPLGSISHQGMLEIILAKREIKTAKELGQLVGCHPAMIQQICKGSTPVSERVAKEFGYQRHKVGGDFWFKKVQKESEIQHQPKTPTKSNGREGLPKIIRTSPFEGAPKVVHRGPFQQLLDATLENPGAEQ